MNILSLLICIFHPVIQIKLDLRTLQHGLELLSHLLALHSFGDLCLGLVSLKLDGARNTLAHAPPSFLRAALWHGLECGLDSSWGVIDRRQIVVGTGPDKRNLRLSVHYSVLISTVKLRAKESDLS